MSAALQWLHQQSDIRLYHAGINVCVKIPTPTPNLSPCIEQCHLQGRTTCKQCYKGTSQLQSPMMRQHRLGSCSQQTCSFCAQVELPAKVHPRRASIAGPAPSSYMSPRRTSVAVISGVSLMPPDELHSRQDGLRGALPSALRARHHAGQFLKWNMCKPAWSCNQCKAFLPSQAVPKVIAFSPMTCPQQGTWSTLHGVGMPVHVGISKAKCFLCH